MTTKVKDGKQLDLFSISSSGVGAGATDNAHSVVKSGDGNLKSATTSPIAISVEKFCETCFRTFPSGEMGKDPRYCKECEANLTDEWQSMATRGIKIKPGWVPRNGSELRPVRKHKHNGNGNGIKELPVRKINKLAAKGMSSKRIAAELIKQGYSINYRAIAKMVKKK